MHSHSWGVLSAPGMSFTECISTSVTFLMSDRVLPCARSWVSGSTLQQVSPSEALAIHAARNLGSALPNSI